MAGAGSVGAIQTAFRYFNSSPEVRCGVVLLHELLLQGDRAGT
jgi:hypothetical protein